jgi:hypothetical protein
MIIIMKYNEQETGTFSFDNFLNLKKHFISILT